MRFYSAIFTTASLIGAVVAQSATVFFTETPTSVVAGTPVTLKYTAPNGPVTITLRKGSPSNLQTIEVITSGATGGSFTWTPDKTLTSGSDYALEITQNGQDNFSGQFGVTGGTGTASVASAASAASAATPTTGAVSTPTTVTATVRQASSSTGTPSGTPSTPTPSSASSRSASSATTTRSATSSASAAPSTGAAGMNSHSPVALIFGAVAAMAYLN